MKTVQDYQELRNELVKIRVEHKEEGLDPNFISVRASGMNWREAKKIGMKKDYYYGWVFYSTATNSSGYDLYEKIKQACEGFKLSVVERQL